MNDRRDESQSDYREDLRGSAARFPEKVAESLAVQASLVDSLLEESRLLLLITDPALRIVRANGYAASILGISARDLLGKALASLVEGEGEAGRLASSAQALRRGSDRETGVSRLRGPAGGPGSRARLTLSLLAAGGGEPYGFLAAGSPIRGAEGSGLDTSNGFIDRLLHGLEEAVFLVDPFSRTIVDCNAGAEALFGWERAELVGSSTRKLFPDQASFESWVEALGAAHARAGIHQDELRLQKKWGASLHCASMNIAVFDEAGAIAYDIAIIRDTTAEKRKEARLGRLIARVGELAAELGELAEDQGPEGEGPSLSSLGFTQRQAEIARLIASGLTSKEAAFRLGLAESTVKNHLAAMFRKLGVASRIDFLRVLSERGIRLV